MPPKTLDWVKANTHPHGGIRAWPGSDAYPEVSGYMIPTLISYGENDLARDYADWLLTVQNRDGSWNGLDGIPRTFDTAACVEGLEAAGEAFGKLEYKTAAGRGKTWMNGMEHPHGGLRASGVNMEHQAYSMRASAIAGRKQDAAHWMRAGFGTRYRAHYAAYCLEGLLNIGEERFVRDELRGAMGACTVHDLMPFYCKPGWVPDGDTDTCATAQIVTLALRLGMNPSDYPDLRRMISGARNMVNDDGGVNLSVKEDRPVAWAAKFYLDMEKILEGRHLLVVVGINHWDDITGPFVSSLKRHNPHLPVLLVDNASDRSYPETSGVDLLRLDERVGYNIAMNAAIQHKKADWYLFFNNDCICRWHFSGMLESLDENTLYGSGPNYDPDTGAMLQWSAWMAVSRKAIDDIGMFDTSFDAGYEDFDLQKRALAAGYKLEFLDLPVEHLDKHTRFEEPEYKKRLAVAKDRFKKKQYIMEAA